MQSFQNNNSKTVAVVSVLALLLLIALSFYVYDLRGRYQQNRLEIISNRNNWEDQLLKIRKLKNQCEFLTQENIEYTDDIKSARVETIKLMDELAKCDKNKGISTTFRSRINALETRLKNIIEENNKIKKLNATLEFQKDSISKILSECQKLNPTFVQKAAQNASIVDNSKINNLKIESLKVTTFKVKKTGQQIVTDVAKKINLINIDFVIAENLNVSNGNRSFYAQITDIDNNVLQSNLVVVGATTLSYTAKTDILFEGTETKARIDIDVSTIKKGAYKVYLYCNDQIVSDSKFMLF